MDQTKPAITSIGVMGPAISLVVLLANQFYPGLGLTPELVGGLVNNIGQVIDLASGTVAALSGIYGRWKATRAIGGVISAKT